jgi:hypothetical protein
VTQLVQAPATGGSDASDRHPQGVGDVGVVGSRTGRDDPEQLLAAFRQAVEALAHQLGLVVEQHLLLG